MTSELKAEELKPCPFCGNINLLVVPYVHSHQFGCSVICRKDNCGASGTWYSRESKDAAKDAAIIAWNTRATTPPAAPAEGAVEAMNDALAESLLLEYSSYPSPIEVIKRLSAQGWHLRRETMSEEELEREAEKLTKDMFEWVDSINAVFIVGLAKKFAGMV